MHMHTQCCTVVFQYLTMLRQIGPQIRIFRELQTIEDNSFRFKEEDEPVEYAYELVENMQLYPPLDYLTGDELMFEYDPEMIAALQDALTPANACLVVLSNQFDDAELDQKEPWFKTAYAVQDVPATWNDRWRRDNLELNSDLHIPKPNQFIGADHFCWEIQLSWLFSDGVWHLRHV
eukprot:m.116353 g.116353  ORF g.116353 m.116353 type:complete len:177 (+) comp37578_c0_seq60:2301-2831(+)